MSPRRSSPAEGASQPLTAASAKAVRSALLRWYDANRRDLPWRRSRDPYAIWISETMLQQTRVETAIPYYERFLERFPDVGALASADSEDVYALWAGLGYYSRARNLHAAARKIAGEWGGRLPDDAQALRELPGVGRYTAGAVASIAFDREEPVVDGNVTRVLARLLGIRSDVKQGAIVRLIWDQAGLLARGPRTGALNQALMELGATLCVPRSPHCDACPIASQCDAKRAGDADDLPVKSRARPATAVTAAVVAVRRRARLLAVRRPAGGLLGGLWELPGAELAKDEPADDGLRRALHERVGLRLESVECVGEVEHLFTHRRLRLHVFRSDTPKGRVRLSGFDDHRWLDENELGDLPQAAVTRKALALLGGP